MQYMGSKARIAKKLLPILNRYRCPGQLWVEPFVGAGGLIQHVSGPRVGADLNEYLVAFLSKCRDGWVPEPITEEVYQRVKAFKEGYDPEFVAYVGYGCSFGGKFFKGFARSANRDHSQEAIRSIKKQAPKLAGCEFIHCGYNELEIPRNSFIYCDPPYKSTERYGAVDPSDSEKFYQWCRNKMSEGHTVILSEYAAPADFDCIFELEHNTTMNKNKASRRVERLFMPGIEHW